MSPLSRFRSRRQATGFAGGVKRLVRRPVARVQHAFVVQFRPQDLTQTKATKLARFQPVTGKDGFARIAARRLSRQTVKKIVIDSGLSSRDGQRASHNLKSKPWAPSARPHDEDLVRKTIRIDSYRPLEKPIGSTDPSALKQLATRVDTEKLRKHTGRVVNGVGRVGARQSRNLAALTVATVVLAGSGIVFLVRMLWRGALGLFGTTSAVAQIVGTQISQLLRWAGKLRPPKISAPSLPMARIKETANATRHGIASISMPSLPSVPRPHIRPPSWRWPAIALPSLGLTALWGSVGRSIARSRTDPSFSETSAPRPESLTARIETVREPLPEPKSEVPTTEPRRRTRPVFGRFGPALTYFWLVMTRPAEPKPAKRRRRWRPTIPLLSPSMNLAVFAGAGLLAVTVKSLPSPALLYPLERTLEQRTERQLVIHTAAGKPFAHRGGCVEAPVTVNELPRHLIDALVAMEDRRFFSHYGIDPKGIIRAAKRNFDARRVVEGGSTITQQLAKIAYLSRDRTFDRKLQELLIVLRLELLLTKNQILERYLSTAYFGSGCHGLRAATRHYFGKKVKDLTISESAYLVALLRSPSKLTRQPDLAVARQQLVLSSMVETGSLTSDRRASLKPMVLRAEKPNDFGAYYADWIEQTIKLPDDGQSTPLKVQTSFDPTLQRLADKTLKDVLVRWGKGVKASQMALVAMRPDGRVVAMVGGRDYGKSQFNRAFQAQRQPGSAFKTFVYMAALRKGAQPNMRVADQPLTIGEWSPQNFGHNFRGNVSLQQAFASSINTVAVRLSEASGRDDVIGAARDLGIQTTLQSTPSIALGTSEVNLVELTSAYAAISADAYPVRPWGVTALGSQDAKLAKPPQGAGEWKLMVGDHLRSMLGTVVSHGTARGARLPIPAYGKTGTSQDFRDAWFVGFAGNLVVGVWVGNDDNSSMRGVTGGSLPASIWRYFMTLARAKDKSFKAKPGKVATFEAKAKTLQTSASREFASLLTPPQPKVRKPRRRSSDDRRFSGGFYYGGRYYYREYEDPRSYRRYAPPRRTYRNYRRQRRGWWSGDGG